jgi:hypothetical protein
VVFLGLTTLQVLVLFVEHQIPNPFQMRKDSKMFTSYAGKNNL